MKITKAIMMNILFSVGGSIAPFTHFIADSKWDAFAPSFLTDDNSS
jgi:hypothetical protein